MTPTQYIESFDEKFPTDFPGALTWSEDSPLISDVKHHLINTVISVLQEQIDSMNQEWRESHDYKQAEYAAEKALERPYADLDDDLGTLARQFNRISFRYNTTFMKLTKTLSDWQALIN